MSSPNTSITDLLTDLNGQAAFIPNEIFPSKILHDVVPKMPEGYIMRPLRITDLDRGFTDLLSQLTVVGNVTSEQLFSRYCVMAKMLPLSYYIIVIEDLSTEKIVGSATLVIEWKFIHEAGSRGRIEDVVVDKTKRGLGFGKLLNECLVELGKKLRVYKLSLECKDKLISFYEQFGFKKDEGNNFLVQRFD